MTLLYLATTLVILLALAFLAAPAWLAAVSLALIAAGGWLADMPLTGPVIASVATGVLALCAAPPLRRRMISDRLFNWFRTVLPSMSRTEQEALEAGSVWWDAELFSGRPRWQRLFSAPRPGLNTEERAFLDGPVEELCRMLDDWKINREDLDLPPEVWDFLREHRFFSMIIPREYGGLDFSAQANAAIVARIASRNQVAATTVMVPNSLGPGELLNYFGTEDQKNHYLPRLARGEEIPCFALTSPLAGSDAASMPDEGVVCKGMYEGEEVLGLRVNWDKRYITLAPVATLLGLAFKVSDPDGLLGDDKAPGITCALIPTDTPGVELGARHLPGGSAFMNGPTRGKDVFIPLDWVIGGRERVGQGWRMLMHCLSAGRAISLPALSIANGKLASMTTGAYARIRQQFKQPIGAFEGVQEPLARIGGETYRMDAAQRLTLVALDEGEKPVVLSAILKYSLTEANRRLLNDAMDIHGGKAVVEGPLNYLASAYQAIPIAITVEGANILTRTMIVFGQGAIRCHPWLLKEMEAARNDDTAARRAFDHALWGHAGYLISNSVRAPLLGLTGGRLSRSPISGPTAWACRRINRLVAAFTLISDLCLLILGGKFKFREMLSGRLADALSHLYMASAVVKRFEDDGRPDADLPLVQWALEDSFHQVEEALQKVLDNFPAPALAPVIRLLAFPLSRSSRAPSDDRLKEVAALLMDDTESRRRLIDGVFESTADDGTGLVNKAFAAVLAAEPADRAVRNALKTAITPINYEALTEKAVASGVITAAQAGEISRAQELAGRVIAVDEFAPDALENLNQPAPDLRAAGNE